MSYARITSRKIGKVGGSRLVLRFRPVLFGSSIKPSIGDLKGPPDVPPTFLPLSFASAFVCPSNVARPVRTKKLRLSVAGVHMVCLPRVVDLSFLAANPAHHCRGPHLRGTLTVVTIVRAHCPFPVKTPYRGCPVLLPFVTDRMHLAPRPLGRPPTL